MKYTRKLSVVEQRGIPLTHENVTIGMWVRVKTDVDSVKKMCRGDGDAQARAPRPLACGFRFFGFSGFWFFGFLVFFCRSALRA
jgi:hypothetical protein